MDYNEDRQLVIENDNNVDIMESWVESVDRSNDHDKCSIYLDTIEPIKLIGEGKYNLNAVKEIQVTESYLGMDEDIRGCQNQLSMENCTTNQYLETCQNQCGCIPFN